MANRTPTNIVLHQKSRVLEIEFDDNSRFELPCEYLRVHSPSAEVRGHAPGQGTLPVGKSNVGLNGVEPVGNYAVKLTFDDGHDTGLYSWDYLYELWRNQERMWREYLNKAKQLKHE
ncbi:MAG: DUF971 domain-containing protein [Gammaproteobacteria bacterium]